MCGKHLVNLQKIKLMFKKRKTSLETISKELINKGTETCILKIRLLGISKIEDHFIYECIYIDEKILKTVPVVAKNVHSVVNILSPYVNKGKSEQWTAFQIGSENAVASRMK